MNHPNPDFGAMVCVFERCGVGFEIDGGPKYHPPSHVAHSYEIRGGVVVNAQEQTRTEEPTLGAKREFKRFYDSTFVAHPHHEQRGNGDLQGQT
jgi:hypothetical protein